ncbi:MAG: serine hydrolase [Chloroflexia bacterium]
MRQVNRRFRLAVLLALTATLFQPGLVRPSWDPARASADEPSLTLFGSAPDAPDSELQSIVEDAVGDLPGTWGVAIKKLDTGQYAEYNSDKQQISASLYKVWVLCELFRQVNTGVVTLDDEATVTSDDAYEDSVSGDLRFDVGDSVSLGHAAELMVTLSDNTAAHVLVRNLGVDNINRTMQQNGLTNSVLNLSGNGDNLTTPRDMLHVMELLATSQLVSAKASKDMISLLLDQQINNLLPPGLPGGTPFAHKTGALDYLLHDAGIVYSPAGPFVIVVLASHMDDYGTAWTNMPELSRRVYNYFTTRPGSPALYFPRTRQSVGHDFLKFWYSYGGASAFGDAITPEMKEGDTLVQYFERGRLEWHPENAGAGGPQPQVSLGLVGQERAAQLGLSWPRGTDTGAGQYFDGTGQTVTGAFLTFWLNNGGQRAFGLPISPAGDMVSPTDGKTYVTQWFQRARMEYHPDLPSGKQVVLAPLGSEIQAAKSTR